MISITNKQLRIFSYLYLYVPIIIWISTWTKIWYAILAVATLGYILYKSYCKNKKIKVTSVTYSVPELITMVVFILALAYICGWGGFVSQCDDFPKHNAILNDLTTRSWPVYYENNGVQSRLSYYLGSYIVSGSIGKISFLVFQLTEKTAFYVSSYALLVWNCIGLFLVINHFLILLKNPNHKLLYIALFLLMGNFIPLVIRYYAHLAEVDVNVLISNGFSHLIDFGRLRVEYTTNFALIRWVFQYSLPTWIIISMFFERKDESEYIVIGLPLLLFAPFCLIGLIPFMALALVIHLIQSKNATPISDFLSGENLLALAVLGSFGYLYLKGSVFNPNKSEEAGFSTQEFWKDSFALRAYWFTLIACVLVFLLLCIIGLALKKNKKTTRWFYLALSAVMLFAIPYFRLGINNDLASRVSIPALFVIQFMLIQLMVENKGIYRDILIFFAVLSLVNTFIEISVILNQTDLNTIHNEYIYAENTLEVNANPNLEIRDDLKWNYYDYIIDDSLIIK